MKAYVIRRLLLMIPTLLILTVIVFLTVRFIPGDAIDAMVIRLELYDVDREDLLRTLGLDVPVHVQYGQWISGILLRGTFGESLFGGPIPIEERILAKLPVTMELGLMAIVIAIIIALPVGIYSAIRQDGVGDFVGRSAAVIGLATPNFWLGIMVVIYPAIWWGWTPPLEYVSFGEDQLENLGILFIPSLILGTAMSAQTMRLTRTMMLEVLRQDYIRTAWAKGLKEKVVVIRHALKNAMIPVVTGIGLSLPLLVGGSVILENIFNLPGLGRLAITALEERDYPVISAVNLFFATAVLAFNLLIDLIYPYLDPRVRHR